MPSNQFLVKNSNPTFSNANFDILHVINCGLRAFRLVTQQIVLFSTLNNLNNDGLVEFDARQAFYTEIIQNFASDFCTQLDVVFFFNFYSLLN